MRSRKPMATPNNARFYAYVGDANDIMPGILYLAIGQMYYRIVIKEGKPEAFVVPNKSLIDQDIGTRCRYVPGIHAVYNIALTPFTNATIQEIATQLIKQGIASPDRRSQA